MSSTQGNSRRRSRRQAVRIGEAAQSIIDGARQIELTAAAVARLNEHLEQETERLSAISCEPNHDLVSQREPERLGGVTESTIGRRQSTQADGAAEVVLRSIDPHDLARYKAQIAEAKMTEQPVEKKQDLVKRQEQPKQRQKNRAKKRDRGMER